MYVRYYLTCNSYYCKYMKLDLLLSIIVVHEVLSTQYINKNNE